MKTLSIKEMIKYIDVYAARHGIVPKTNEDFEGVDEFRKEHPNVVNFCISIKDREENERIHYLASKLAREEGLEDSDFFLQMYLEDKYDEDTTADRRGYRIEMVYPVNYCSQLWIIDRHWSELRRYTRYITQRLNGVKIRLFTPELKEISIE